MPSLGFSPHLSALTASPCARAGDPFRAHAQEGSAAPHSDVYILLYPTCSRAAGRRVGLDPQCCEWAAGHSHSCSCSGCGAAGLKFGSSSFSLSGNGLQGFCVMQGVSGRSNVFWHHFISFISLYYCFFWFSSHLCCKCKEQIGSRDVRWDRTTPCSSRCMCWWWLTAINCSPRGYVLYLIGQSIICIKNLDVHLVRAYCAWVVYTEAIQTQTRQKILRNTLV